MNEYLNDNGIEVESLGKKEVAVMIKTAPDDPAEVLALRLQLAKSSVKKNQAMQNAVCDDGRCHGMFQSTDQPLRAMGGPPYPAAKSAPESHGGSGAGAALVKAGDYKMLDMLYDSVPGCFRN